VSCGSDHKVVIADVTPLFDDPWSPLLASYYKSGEASSSMSKEEVVGHESGKELKPSGLRYSHVLAHADYVKKVKCEISNGDNSILVFSAGLDGKIKMFGVRPEGGPLVSMQTYDAKTSLYGLATSRNNESWLIATGGADGVIKVFDSREDKKCALKLKGHSDIVKTLYIPSSRSHMLVSGGADSSIRIWDFRTTKQQNCLALHEDSVWSLSEVPSADGSTSSNHLEFYSGGRDGSVYWTNVDTSETRFLFKEDHPILCIAPVNSQSMWVSTTDPSITHWELTSIVANQTPNRRNSLMLASSPITSPGTQSLSPTLGNMLEVGQQPAVPLLTTQQAVSKTPTRASLVSHHVFPDKHRVLTRDSSGRVQIWNVVTMKLEHDLGITQDSNEALVTALAHKRFLPSWFTAETRSGQLTIHIDPFPRCTEASYMTEAVLLQIDSDKARPLSLAVANAFKVLFRGYFADSTLDPRVSPHPGQSSLLNDATGDENPSTNNAPPPAAAAAAQNDEPLDVIVSVSKDGGLIWREHAKNITHETYVPEWVENVIQVPRYRPPSPTITFLFNPHRPGIWKVNNNPGHQFKMHRSFTAFAMAEYLVSTRRTKLGDQNGFQTLDVTIRLNNIDIPMKMDLGSIKHFFWKSSDPLPLTYDFEEPQPRS
jgi:hypothetical protein